VESFGAESPILAKRL
jgi:hypothetical protein